MLTTPALSPNFQAYLSDFLKFCESLGGATAYLMKVRNYDRDPMSLRRTRLSLGFRVQDSQLLFHSFVTGNPPL